MASIGSTHKKQKEEVDIISKLPDSLISHILSFLPTKDAVCTSVLSKRWIDCWTLINKVNLDDSVLLYYTRKKKKSSEKQQHFINFVYKTLLLIKSYGMESFSLVITNKYDVAVINSWISCILNRRPKKIHIRTTFELSVSALTSYSLFNHTYSLEELVLEMCYSAIKVPPSRFGYYGFRNLKVIKLCGIIFTIDKSLVIDFSVLKKFETKNSCWLSAHDVTIKAPLLESVSINQDRNSVFRKPHSCKIKFSASCIKEFTYCGYGGISQSIVLSNSSAASNASVNIFLHKNGSYVQETESCAFILLKQFSKVKCIKFHGSEVLTQPNVAVLPKFAMLSHLDLDFVNVEVLLGLLQKCSVLNTLLFKGISKFNQELLNSAVVPGCLTSTLQVVKFENVRGSEHELFLAKYFMENSIMLERMSFSLANPQLSKSKVIEDFKEKLYSFKKGVSFAILEFYY